MIAAILVATGHAREFDSIEDEDFIEFMQALIEQGEPVTVVDSEVLREEIEDGLDITIVEVE